MSVKRRSSDDSRETLARAWAWHTWHPGWLPGHLVGAIRRLALHRLARKGLAECRLDSGQRFLADPGEVIQCHIGARGEWEGEIYQALRPLVGPGDTVLDVGAHVGYSTLLFAQWVGPSGKVYSFEPFAPLVEQIRANVSLNAFDERVEIISAGVSDVAGNADFYKPRGSNSGVGSLAKPGKKATPVSIQTLRLDDWIRTHELTGVALCKLDIEGAEGRALAGMAEALGAHVAAAFLIELHPPELLMLGDSVHGVLRTLAEAGYEIRYWGRSSVFANRPDADGCAYVLALARDIPQRVAM